MAMCGADSYTCIQKKKKFIKVEPFVEVSSGAPDDSVTRDECEAMDDYASPYDGNGSPRGCTKFVQNGNVYWNINSQSSSNCGSSGYNCVEKKPLSLQQCMVAVHRAGYAAGHHSFAANVDGTGEWTAGS